MNAARKLALGSASRTVSLLVQVVVGMWLMPFIIHTLGDRIYGYWTLVAAFLGYYGLLDLGIVTAVTYRVARSIGERNKEDINQTVSTAFVMFGLIGLLLLAITVVAAFVSKDIVKNPTEAALFAQVLLIMGIGFATGFPCRAFLGALAAELRFDLISGLGILGVLVRAALIVILLKAGHGIVALAMVTMVVDLCQNLANYIFLKIVRPAFRLSIKTATRKIMKDLFGYSVFTFIAKIADQIRFNMDVFIIGAFLGIGAVTHYAIAKGLTGYFRNFIISLIGGIGPMFSQQLGRQDEDAMRRTFVAGTKLSSIFAISAGLCLVIYGKPFISAWMGTDYIDAYVPLSILIVGAIAWLAQQPSVGFLFGIARHKFLAYSNSVEALLNLSLSLLLVSRYKMLGVAIGYAIPMIIIRLLVQPFYVCKCLKMHYADYYYNVLGKDFAKISIVFILSWWLLSRHFIRVGIIGLVAPIALTLILTLPISFFWVLNSEQRRWLFSHLGIIGLRNRGKLEEKIKAVGPEETHHPL
jgi:O-antigen/teichoic acid export membrane protein